jgi:hypothetical protein
LGTPKEFVLEQNYPNPFNPNTTIKYYVPGNSFVTIKIYDVLGNELKTLINDEKSAGYYKIDFDASQFSSGIYIYELKSNEFVASKKMLLIR